MSEEDQIVDNYEASPHAGAYNQTGGRYHRHQRFTHDSVGQDCNVSIMVNDIEMYGLFCGFKNGREVSEYATNKMVVELFQETPINKNMSHQEMIEILRDRFLMVNRRLVSELNETLTQIYLLENPSFVDEMGPTTSEEVKEKISELKNKVRAGCTALVVLRVNDDLYLLNCGTSQALIFTDHQQVVRLIEAVHDNENPEEIQRLKNIGVNPSDLTAPTRAIGDAYRSIRYEEEFKTAKAPPVIYEPEVFQVSIQPGWRHLLLVSGGVVQNIKDCDVDDVPMEIYEQFKEQQNYPRTASHFVHNIIVKHEDAYNKHVKECPEATVSNYREEMSVIYVKLQDAPSIIHTIDSSLSSTVASISLEPETLEPYIDLSPTRANQVTKELEKFLVVPATSSH